MQENDQPECLKEARLLAPTFLVELDAYKVARRGERKRTMLVYYA